MKRLMTRQELYTDLYKLYATLCARFCTLAQETNAEMPEDILPILSQERYLLTKLGVMEKSADTDDL